MAIGRLLYRPPKRRVLNIAWRRYLHQGATSAHGRGRYTILAFSIRSSVQWPSVKPEIGLAASLFPRCDAALALLSTYRDALFVQAHPPRSKPYAFSRSAYFFQIIPIIVFALSERKVVW